VEEGVSIDCVIDEVSRIIKITLKKVYESNTMRKRSYMPVRQMMQIHLMGFYSGVSSENELPPIIYDSDNEHYPENQSTDTNNEEEDYKSDYDDDNSDDNELPLIVDE